MAQMHREEPSQEVRILNTCKVGDTSVYRFKESYHRQKGAVKSRNMIKVERQIGGTTSNLFTIFHQLFYATYLRKRRSHCTNSPCTYLLCMFCQTPARLHTSTAHMNNHFEAFGSYFNPTFGQLHAFFFRQHIAFAGRTVDKNTFQTILC